MEREVGKNCFVREEILTNEKFTVSKLKNKSSHSTLERMDTRLN